MNEWITISQEDSSELWNEINEYLNLSDSKMQFKYPTQQERELKVLTDENGNITYVKLDLVSNYEGGLFKHEQNLDGEEITKGAVAHRSYETGFPSALNHPYEMTFPTNSIIECINNGDNFDDNIDFRVYDLDTGELNFREISDGGLSYRVITHKNGQKTKSPLDIKDTDLNDHLDVSFLQEILGKNISELKKDNITK